MKPTLGSQSEARLSGIDRFGTNEEQYGLKNPPPIIQLALRYYTLGRCVFREARSLLMTRGDTSHIVCPLA